jgi:non-specific serine/threonine protein kinase
LGAPLLRADRPVYDQGVSAVRTALGEVAFRAAWAEGRALPPEQATEVALAGDTPAADAASPPPSRLSAPLGSLTRREREVAGLLARGLTNREIAEALVLGERTAEGHVSNLLGKLGLASRAQAVAWLLEHGVGTSATP